MPVNKNFITCQSFTWSNQIGSKGFLQWEIQQDQKSFKLSLQQDLTDAEIEEIIAPHSINEENKELLLTKFHSVNTFLGGASNLIAEGLGKNTKFDFFAAEYRGGTECTVTVGFAEPKSQGTFTFHPREVSYDEICATFPDLDKRSLRKVFVVLKRFNLEFMKVLRKNTPLRGW